MKEIILLQLYATKSAAPVILTTKKKKVYEMENNKRKLQSFHLFAGAGGGILADILLGHQVVGACELEEYPREVMLQRQRDGVLPEFPIWDDVETFDGKPWRGAVDIICGGFPCQDISAAGKGAGIAGARSGLWGEFARIIEEIEPTFAFIENSPLLRTRGLDRILKDLAGMGYNARWGVLGAGHIGASHKRNRMWVLAYSGNQRNGQRLRKLQSNKQTLCRGENNGRGTPIYAGGQWWQDEPRLDRMAYGVDSRLHRFKAIGNGQVPQVAATAFRILSKDLI